MGQTSSKSVQKQITSKDLNISNNEFNNLKQSCSVDTSAQNIVKMKIMYGSKLNINQKNSVENVCILDAYMNSDVSSEVKSKTINDLYNKQKTEGGIFAASSEADQQIHQNLSLGIDNSATSDVIQQCLGTMKADNRWEVDMMINSEANVDQANKAMNKCMFQYAQERQLNSGITEESHSKSKNIQDTFGGGLFNMEMIMGIIVIVLIVGGMYFLNPPIPLPITGDPLYNWIITILICAVVIFLIWFFFFKKDSKDSEDFTYLKTPKSENFIATPKTYRSGSSLISSDGPSINILNPGLHSQAELKTKSSLPKLDILPTTRKNFDYEKKKFDRELVRSNKFKEL